MEQHRDRGALSENIALLGQFGKTLADPIINDTPPWVNRDSQGIHERSLTFEQEQRTAEAFALLLATTDDRNAIGAVCVEEQPDGSGFIVRTAVNSGSQNERLDTFRRLVNAARLSLKSRKSDVVESKQATLN
jgi:hypothetical protein